MTANRRPLPDSSGGGHIRCLSVLALTVVKEFVHDARGDEGVLRLINSYRVNASLGRVFSEDVVKRATERVGLGGGVIITGRRRET